MHGVDRKYTTSLLAWLLVDRGVPNETSASVCSGSGSGADILFSATRERRGSLAGGVGGDGSGGRAPCGEKRGLVHSDGVLSSRNVYTGSLPVSR